MGRERAVPLATTAVVARLVAAERACMVDWLQALAAEPGNPFGIAIRRFGGATALLCRAIPADVFNRVFELTPADGHQVPAILAFYAEHGVRPLVDLSPYAVPPYWQRPNLPAVLARHGLYQGAFHQILYGVPTTAVPPPAAGVTVREVGPPEAAVFGRLYEQVWGDGGAIRVLLGRPPFRCYLAEVEGEPAGLGVLHIAEGVGSMANALTTPAYRGRGCQLALLAHRIHDAAVAGCELLASQCLPGSSSQRNQVRAGLHIAGSKAWWLPLPVAEPAGAEPD